MSGDDTPKRKTQPGNLKPAWEPGKSGNPTGRPKGSRTKLMEAFVSKLQADFVEHGARVIAQVRAEKPDQYLKVIASIMPKQLNVNTNAIGDMSDDELEATLAAIQSIARQLRPVAETHEAPTTVQ